MSEEKSPFDDVPQFEQDDYEAREDTRAFILDAGIHRHASKNRQIALAIGAVVVVAVCVVGLDSAGIVQLLPEEAPDLVHSEPAKKTAAAPAENGENPKLRSQLLGLNKKPAATPVSPTQAGTRDNEKAIDARSLFEDEKKAPKQLTLSAAKFRTEVALPDGLTGEAIQKVVQDNAGATRLCIAESMRAGEANGGKAEFDLSIAASGEVENVTTRTGSFKGSKLASCMVRRMRSWRFPSFEGAPVVVVIPYVITQGI